MSKEYERAMSCLRYVKEKVNFVPKVGMILGSGLGDMVEGVDIRAVVDYSEIPDFPTSTVAGHRGRFVFGYMEGVAVVIMQGRIHYYEGYAMTDVVLPTRLMCMLGIEILILTNAAGGIDFSMQVGDLMLITDHISSFIPSPLIGENVAELGTRFPDMSEVYKKELCTLIRDIAKKTNISLKEGVYIQFSGPNFETPAEIRMARVLGAHAVGMSTACEAMVANHAGVKVCGISVISNLGCGMNDVVLSDDDVKETANKVGHIFKKFLQDVIKAMGEL